MDEIWHFRFWKFHSLKIGFPLCNTFEFECCFVASTIPFKLHIRCLQWRKLNEKEKLGKIFLPELEPQNQFCDVIKSHVINYALANIIVFKPKTENLKWCDFLEHQEVHFTRLLACMEKRNCTKKSTGLFLEEKYGSRGGDTLNFFKLP